MNLGLTRRLLSRLSLISVRVIVSSPHAARAVLSPSQRMAIGVFPVVVDSTDSHANRQVLRLIKCVVIGRDHEATCCCTDIQRSVSGRPLKSRVRAIITITLASHVLDTVSNHLHLLEGDCW